MDLTDYVHYSASLRHLVLLGCFLLSLCLFLFFYCSYFGKEGGFVLSGVSMERHRPINPHGFLSFSTASYVSCSLDSISISFSFRFTFCVLYIMSCHTFSFFPRAAESSTSRHRVWNAIKKERTKKKTGISINETSSMVFPYDQDHDQDRDQDRGVGHIGEKIGIWDKSPRRKKGFTFFCSFSPWVCMFELKFGVINSSYTFIGQAQSSPVEFAWLALAGWLDLTEDILCFYKYFPRRNNRL